MDLPPGLTLIDQPQDAVTDVLPPPPGLTVVDQAPLPQLRPPPPGLTIASGNENAPVPAATPSEPEADIPFWEATRGAFGRGLAERTLADIAGAKTILPIGESGKTVSAEQQFQQDPAHPETKDQIDRLKEQDVFNGYTDPKWWAVHIAHGVGGSLPGLGAGAVGGLIGGGVGAAAGFGVEGALGTFIPAYKAARLTGLSEDDAFSRAAIDSGLAGLGGVAMGVAPALSVFGRAANEIAPGIIINGFKRPLLEAMTQLGIIQPSLGVATHVATTLSHGETPSFPELATTYIDGVGMGAAMVAGHAAAKKISNVRRSMAPELPPATPERVQQSFENQKPGEEPPPVPPPTDAAPATSASAAPDAVLTTLSDRELFPSEHGIFFSPIRDIIAEKVPNNASPEQVLQTLRNAKGVREEEINDLRLPAYLADQNGKVNKADLLAHVEANSLILVEKVLGVDEPNNRTEGIGGYSTQVLPGDRETYREFILKTPSKVVDPDVASVEKRALEMAGKFSWDRTTEDTRAHYRKLAHYDLYHEVNGIPKPAELDGPHGWQYIDGENLPGSPRDFNATHHGDPNIVAHIRATVRADRDGKYHLHVEEVQSDWHQMGKKTGYRNEKIRPFEVVGKELGLLLDQMKALTKKSEIATNSKAKEEFQAERERLIPRKNALFAEYEAAIANDRLPPDGPFKSSWEELAFKRMLRHAADNGYERMSWANGDQVGLRLSSREELKGARDAYDGRMLNYAKKWAKRIGMRIGTTEFPGQEPEFVSSRMSEARMQALREMGILEDRNRKNYYVEINPAAGEKIRQGLSLYDKPAEFKLQSNYVEPREAAALGIPDQLRVPGLKIGQIFHDFAQKFGLKFSLSIHFEPNAALSKRGEARIYHGKAYEIRLNTARIRTAEELYAVAAHEFGHIIMHDKFEGASDKTKQEIFRAYDEFRTSMGAAGELGGIHFRRDNAVTNALGTRNEIAGEGSWAPKGAKSFDIPLSDVPEGTRKYLLSFEEWFAEQVARWATADEKPLSVVDKMFATIGKTIRQITEGFARLTGLQVRPHDAMQRWLDSFLTDMQPFAADVRDGLELNTLRRNQDAFDRDGTPEVAATPQTGSTSGGRNILDQLPPSGRSDGPAMAAHADRINKFFTWMTSLPQIAEMNKHVRGLQDYKEHVALWNLEKNNILGAAFERLKQWKAMRDEKQQVALGRFIDDYKNGLFKLTNDGIIRRPTQTEFEALQKKHGLSKEAFDIFDGIVKDFDGMLELYRQQLLQETLKIKNPTMRADRVKAVNAKVNEMKTRPYMPGMHFGDYTVTVYDAARKVKHYEQTETSRQARQIKEALEKHANFLPGDEVRLGFVQKDVKPLIGMPREILNLMHEHLNMSQNQIDALDQLRFEYSPTHSFSHRFNTKNTTPGYSTDWQRAYANFFFHGANHFMRVKYVERLRKFIRDVREESLSLEEGVKRDQIRNFMSEHLDMLLDPKPDFAALRGAMFHWYLGFNPKSAVVNVTQTAIMTYPHLASKFGPFGIGDAKAMAAILRATTDLNNFYKKGNLLAAGERAKKLGPEGAVARALAEAVNEGILNETQAHELAAIGEGRNLGKRFGSKAEAAWHNFGEASSWMFEMTEQYNRRVAFRAAHDLAMRDTGNKYVREMVRDNPLQYKRLIDKGWSDQEAAAFVAAKDSVEKTQFVYAPYARPKFMWGRKGALFIFKSFTQNTLFNLWANKSAGARSLLLMSALGGMMGLPGMEDANGIAKSIAYWLFGKQFDVEDEARKFAADVLSGKISPDVLLHGASVKGFGIPHVTNMLGGSVGLPHIPVPVLDMHSSVSMGNILPFEPGKLFAATTGTSNNALQQVQRASGAGFGLGFALYNFLMSNEKNQRAWEKIMPVVASNVSHAWRFAAEGMEKDKKGAAIVRFDMNDTEHMAEVLARAMGFQPRRLTARYEEISGQMEAANYWDLRRQLIIRQYAAALKGNDVEARQRVLSALKEFNQQLPEEWKPKTITGDVIRESIQNRFRAQAKSELGIAANRQNQKAFNEMKKYYPDSVPPGLVGVQQVK